MAVVGIVAQRIALASEQALNEHARQALLKTYEGRDHAHVLGEIQGFQKGLQTAFDLVLKILNEEDKRNERLPEPDRFD